MELMYLYIADYYPTGDGFNQERKGEPYKTIKDCGFNFSNDYIFDVRKIGDKYLLDVQKKESIKNFYDPTGKISNITGVVGKNGTGKTSLLDFIIGITKNKADLRFIDYGFIAVFRTAEKNFDHKNNVVYQSHMNVQFSDVNTITSDFKLLKVDRDNPYDAYFPQFRIIKYSNTFEVNNPDSLTGYGNHELIIDVSTNSILENAALKSKNIGNQYMDIRNEYRNEEIRKQALMVCYSNQEFNFDFKLPQILKLTINLNDINSTLNDYSIDIETRELLRRIKEKIQQEDRHSLFVPNAKKSFLLYIHLAAFFAHIKMLYPYDGIFSVENPELETIIASENGMLAIQNYIKNFGRFYGNQEPRLIQFLTKIESLGSEFFSSFPNKELFFNIDKSSLDILEDYFDDRFFHDFISFEWKHSRTSSGELSTGEKVYFSLFARFYNVAYLSEKYNYSHFQKLLILIDEGEYQLHPAWQRKYIKWLTSYFASIFTQTEKIQIIITSHSPFIVSDLRKEEVIFLEKNEKGITRVSDLEKHKNTFGANIHSLYSDAFFMNEGLIGEFATNKINGLIKFLLGKPKTSRKLGLDENASQMLINIIGEPVLKEHLQNMWDKKFRPEYSASTKEEMTKRIKELENENKRLKNETNKRH